MFFFSPLISWELKRSQPAEMVCKGSMKYTAPRHRAECRTASPASRSHIGTQLRQEKTAFLHQGCFGAARYEGPLNIYAHISSADVTCTLARPSLQRFKAADRGERDQNCTTPSPSPQVQSCPVSDKLTPAAAETTFHKLPLLLVTIEVSDAK